MVTASASTPQSPWKPTRYLEPNHPDNEEVVEQAQYMAAVTRLGTDARSKRYKPRRTVDYMGPMMKWRQYTKMKATGVSQAIHPNPSDIVGLLPPAAHGNPSTSICDYFVHTSINKERSPTRVVKWTPDARRLLTGNDKGQFTLWNGQSFNYESITQVHDDSIRCLAYSHNGQGLISTDKSGMIKYFTPHLTNVHGFQGHREACHAVGWSPNDERFVTGGDDGLVKIWNYREAKEEKALSGHGWDVRCVDWHPRKGLVVSGSKDMLVKFWDPRTGKELSTLHSHKSTINDCKWSPEGHLVATAGGDGQVRLFDIRTFRELEPMKGNTKEVNCIEWHPVHHSLFVTGDSAGSIMYWSLNAPDPAQPVTTLLEAHDDAVFSLAFHPLGHILCSGSKDFTARFWCRARPAGGHEIDRYHLGEAGSMEAKAAGEKGVEMRQWGTGPSAGGKDGDAGKEGDLPGLPGLSNLANLTNLQAQRQSTSSPFAGGPSATIPPSASALPGFSAGSFPPQNTHGVMGGPSAPPQRAWGSDPAGNGGFARGQGPLPSQDDIRRVGGGPGPGQGQGQGQGSGRFDDGPPPPRRGWEAGGGGRGVGGNAGASNRYDRPSDGYDRQSGGSGGGYGRQVSASGPGGYDRSGGAGSGYGPPGAGNQSGYGTPAPPPGYGAPGAYPPASIPHQQGPAAGYGQGPPRPGQGYGQQLPPPPTGYPPQSQGYGQNGGGNGYGVQGQGQGGYGGGSGGWR